MHLIYEMINMPDLVGLAVELRNYYFFPQQFVGYFVIIVLLLSSLLHLTIQYIMCLPEEVLKFDW